MDPQRFDRLSKQIGTRLSRRTALRTGIGAALGALTLNKLAPTSAQDPDTTIDDRFVSVRTYSYTGNISDAIIGLRDLVPLMEQQAGFISIDFVDGDQEIHIVARFLDKTTAVAAARIEDTWISDNADTILVGKPRIKSGDVFLRSDIDTGCACITGATNACGSDQLICCGETNTPGGPGICLPAATICPAGEPVLLPTVAPPVGPPTTTLPCTSEGCDCATGTQAPCDDGLVCCPTTDRLGGPGICQTFCDEAPCTGEGCPCTDTGSPFGTCDGGLQCCADYPGGPGVCAWDCGDEPCTSEGCPCIGGVDGACDGGLQCCADYPGGPGACAWNCGDEPCTGEGCPCTGGRFVNTCDDEMQCCATSADGPYVCTWSCYGSIMQG